MAEAATGGEKSWLWSKGQSGNPAGRPKGSKNQSTLLIDAVLEDKSEALARLAVEKALAGDKALLRFCLSRLLPPARHRAVSFELPDTGGMRPAQAAAAAYEALLRAIAAGEVAPGEAKPIADLIDRIRKEAEEASGDRQVRAGEPARPTAKAAAKPAVAVPAGPSANPSVPTAVAARPPKLRESLLGGTATVPAGFALPLSERRAAAAA
jgi:Family of unknown function (DUF5681)